MKTMAEVLQAHRYDNEKRTLHQHCTCGWAGKPLGFDFWEHQAAALSAAGFGLVADAKAEAWDEGAQAEADTTTLTEEEESAGMHAATFVCPSRNPYRETTMHDEPMTPEQATAIQTLKTEVRQEWANLAQTLENPS